MGEVGHRPSELRIDTLSNKTGIYNEMYFLIIVVFRLLPVKGEIKGIAWDSGLKDSIKSS